MNNNEMIYEWLCEIVETLEALTEQVKGLANEICVDEDEDDMK